MLQPNRIALTFTAAILLATSGCSDDTSSRKAASPNPTHTGNIAHDKLMELDPPTQAIFLGKVVTSSGDPCRGTTSFFQGIYKKDNSAFWSVRCTNGKSYQVSILANATGSTKVMDCAVLKAVAHVSCFQKLD